MIRLRVLGTTELYDASGREAGAVLAQPKRLALLAYLALSPGFQRRDALLALFWPELDAARAREALNQAVRFLRRSLGDTAGTALVSRGVAELGIDPAALWCDAAAFSAHVAAQRWGEAIGLYRGDLLPGFFSENAGTFEAWLDTTRAHLRTDAARAAREVAEASERASNYTTAVIAARRAVELAEVDERAVRRLLTLLDRLGDRAGAVHAYEQFAARLAAELDAEPSAETRALVERIRVRAVAAPDAERAEADAPAAPTARTAQTTQTTQTTPTEWQIVRELGRGGMATVYLARDAKHDRHVALKVLRAELANAVGTERFLREIQITAQLAHPNVLPLIDSGARDGVPYLVTPYVAGESLRARLDRDGRLPPADALRLTTEIADALDYAHRCGVVHRDVKPENVLLADGHAIVADFGIARAVVGADDATTGVAVGSPAYMSPEARRGEPAGPAADLFALGCLLVELLSGTRPAAGDTASTLARRHGTAPRALAALAADCLAVDAAARPRSAGEVARRLEEIVRRPAAPPARWRRGAAIVSAAAVVLAAAAASGRVWSAARSETAPAAGQPHDVAVLYFDDLSPDGRLHHVAAGLTEDLIDRLSRVDGLRVISPNGVRAFRDRGVSLDSIRRTLRVATLVSGSVAGSGSILRLAVRLVDPRSGAELRSHVVQRPVGDLFAMQDSLGAEVSLWLREHLGREVRLAELQRGTTSVDAWQAMYRAEEWIRLAQSHDEREPALLRGADSLLRVAERLDPRWTEPAVRRARVALARAEMRPDRLAAAIALADSILARRADDADALTIRGEASLYLSQVGALPDRAAALRDATADLRRATAARPDLAKPWAVLGDALLADDRYAEAGAAYARALDADAFLRSMRQVMHGLFFTAAMTGRADDAERWCRAGRERYPEDPRLVQCRLIVLGNLGRRAEDVAEIEREAARIDADTAGVYAATWSFRRMMVAAVLARAGRRDSARAVVTAARRDARGRPPAPLAEAYVATLLGDRDEALRLLGALAAADPRATAGVARHPWFATLADDPRFRALAGR